MNRKHKASVKQTAVIDPNLYLGVGYSNVRDANGVVQPVFQVHVATAPTREEAFNIISGDAPYCRFLATMRALEWVTMFRKLATRTDDDLTVWVDGQTSVVKRGTK